jgi:hypothetical protein
MGLPTTANEEEDEDDESGKGSDVRVMVVIAAPRRCQLELHTYDESWQPGDSGSLDHRTEW